VAARVVNTQPVATTLILLVASFVLSVFFGENMLFIIVIFAQEIFFDHEPTVKLEIVFTEPGMFLSSAIYELIQCSQQPPFTDGDPKTHQEEVSFPRSKSGFVPRRCGSRALEVTSW
jgi:hypothetical protein